jgi:hypothetical protein
MNFVGEKNGIQTAGLRSITLAIDFRDPQRKWEVMLLSASTG